MCNDHRTNIKAKIESSCKFLEIKGMKVPISPDGIPMVNLARPINENQSTPNSPESTDQRYGKDLIMTVPKMRCYEILLGLDALQIWFSLNPLK